MISAPALATSWDKVNLLNTFNRLAAGHLSAVIYRADVNHRPGKRFSAVRLTPAKESV